MKLSRLYSDKPDLFWPIDFSAGLSVIMAEIRVPENRKKDTHNLGKTTVGQLLDFGMLLGKDNGFFLFKHLANAMCKFLFTCSGANRTGAAGCPAAC
jgi:uncharacterized protein YydD (DUF2326 family)